MSAVLCVVGDLVEDVIVRPRPGRRRIDTDNPATIERRRGGSAANVAAAAAVAGGTVRFVGRVGDDVAGAALAGELAVLGVDVRVQRGGRTGTVVVVVEAGGRRTMYPDRGAAAELGPIDGSWGEGVTWLHVPAYTWCTDPMGAMAAAFAEPVRRAGARLSVDVSSTSVVDAYGPARFTALLATLAPDVVLATAAEATRLTTDLATTLVVVKDGPRPVIVRHPDGTRESVPVAATTVVDPTGAGDAFAAGYVLAAMAGADPGEAAAAGTRLAARALARVGATIA